MVLGAAMVIVLAGAIIVVTNMAPETAPAVVVSLTQSNAPLQIFSGGDRVLMILPDGSLWTWGNTGTAPAPTQVGTNREWRSAALDASGAHFLALRTNGTLWEWGQCLGGSWAPEPAQALLNHHPNGLAAETDPTQTGLDDDWTGIACGFDCSVALKSNGTLWAWGRAGGGILGNFPNSFLAEPARVDTNRDWVSAACLATASAVGVRKNGTLWGWGIHSTNPTNVAQLGADTNWAGVSDGCYISGLWAWNRKGDFWICSRSVAPLFSLGPAATVPGHLAWAFAGQQSVYDLNGRVALYTIVDGRLMAADVIPGKGGSQPKLSRWRKFARRGDWVGVWGRGAAFGLTADGTIWTWGVDPAAKPAEDWETKLKGLRVKTMEKLGLTPKGLLAGRAPFVPPQIQKEPRPLMRMVVEDSARKK
jgi:hypothetical protein